MSYILEALKRAERERSVGQAPGAGELAQTAAAPPVRRTGLIVALAVLVAANAALAAWLLLRSAAPPQPPAASDTAAAKPLPPPPLPAAAPVAEPAIEDGGTLHSLDDLDAQVEEAAVDEAPPSRPVSVPPRTAPQPGATAAMTPARQAEESGVEEEPAETAEIEAEDVPAPAPAPESMPAPAGALPAGVTALREMPSSYQAGFPNLSMEVHVYDPLPERRFILVSGKRYREGQTLAEGPRVVEIVSDGVVMEHGGRKVLYPLPRR